METTPGYSAGEAKESADSLNPSEGRAISSASLFGKSDRQVVIEHRGEQYRLRVTRNSKLILTK